MTVGEGVMVITIVFVTGAHAPLFVDVSVSVTVPAATSAALGVYTAFIVVLFGENIPVPDVVHTAPVETVNEPFNVTFALFAQTV